MFIELKDVHKSFKKQQVLKGVNLSIEKGELVSLIGPSGCGKTTTLKMINGLIRPSKGDVLIGGKSILQADLIKLRRKMGYVIQQTGLFPHMTIKENIEIIPKLNGADPSRLQKRTEQLMKMVGLDPDEYLWRYPSQLSGGQQQRVGVARAFAVEPDIILMDEPFSALDPITREQLQDEMMAIQNRFHKTVVFVTHDMEEAIKISDRICIMNGGRVHQYDTPEAILKNPLDEFVADFVGRKRIWSNPKYIKARDIMVQTPVKVQESFTVIKAVELMRSKMVDSVFIVDENNFLKGILPGRSLNRSSDMGAPVTSYMQEPVVTVGIDEDMIQLLEKSQCFGVSVMPVLDDAGHLAGLITKSSLVTTLSSQFIEMEAGGIYA